MRLAKYIRVSDEDDDRRHGEIEESSSIGNQRALLDKYIESTTEFTGAEILEFCDDGYTGRNFNRPEVQKMLELVRQKKIDCILVKDLSRFGRNYIDVGAYLEQIFPFCGVRLIAVNQSYDSAKQQFGTAGDIDVVFHNITNDLYSLELSQKAKTARIQYAKRGECIAGDTIYGYLKDPENHRKLIVDEEAAQIVRLIFALRCQGKQSVDIARYLNKAKVPTPMQHKRELGTSPGIWKNREKDNAWDTHAIYRILNEERYTGKAIGHTWVLAEVRERKRKRLPPEEWIIVPDAHPAIISKELFKEVKALVRKTKSHSPGTTKLFSGKVRCGVCGRAMMFSNGKDPYYKCYRRGVGCTGEVKVFVKDLEKAVLEGMRFQGKQAYDLAQQVRERKCELQNKRKSAKSQMEFLAKSTRKLEADKLSLFVELDAGTLSYNEYESRMQDLTEKISGITHERNQLEALLESEVERLDENDFLSAFQMADGITSLTRPVLEMMVKQVEVIDSETIIIQWNFTDQMEQILDLLN